MILLIVRLLINGLAVYLVSQITPGVSVDSFLDAVIVAILLGILNTLVRPILVMLTLPITVFTLGLFILVINIFIILLTSFLMPGFNVSGVIPALLFSLILSVVNWLFSFFIK